MTELSSKQKGNILERRFIELISLGSNGTLSCFTPDSDDDGLDCIVNRKGEYKPVFVQVKSRFNLDSSGIFSQDIGTSTFCADDKFYICFFLFSIDKYDIEKIWLVPSKDFEKKSQEINSVNYKQKLRFAASPKDDSSDQWRQYRVEKKELAAKIEEIIEKLYD